jgi:signal transduction histidine kinase
MPNGKKDLIIICNLLLNGSASRFKLMKKLKFIAKLKIKRLSFLSKKSFGKLIQALCFFYCLAISFRTNAQTNPSRIDIAKIQFSVSLRNHVFFENLSSLTVDSLIPNLKFKLSLPSKEIEKRICIKLSLQNSSDSIQQIYFSPGFYFNDVRIIKINPDQPHKMALVEKNNADENFNAGFILLTLQPRESADFFLVPAQLKQGIISISPHIVNKSFIDFYKINLSNKPINLVTYLVTGVLLMMIFYSLGVYFQDFKTEFLYYSLYAFLIGILIFLKSYLFGTTTITNYYFEGYFDFILQGCGFLFYISFIRKFLQTAQKHPILEKVFSISQWIAIGLLISFSVAWFIGDTFLIPDILENVTKFILIGLGTFFIIYGLGKKNKLISYLIAGQFMLILFSILSFMMVITDMTIVKNTRSIFNASILYYEAGVVFELIFFLTALAYKNKNDIAEKAKESERLKLDNERKEFEKQIAVIEAKSDERNRISADMHDELGAGVTAIRLMSEIVKNKMKNEPLPEIERISYSANELLDKMNAIIWTMLSSNDSAESLITYIRAYAVEFFESTPIDCHVNMPSTIPSIEINGEKRRNIFLSVKETLNNALKHSRATKINININIDKKLFIEIADNGIGINTDKIRRFGNGINNIKKRIESIDGEFNIQNNNGTIMTFVLKL